MLGSLLTAIIGCIHLAIAIAEMGFWTHALVRKAFGTSLEFAAATRVLAANQGLYNAFLAAGLFWGSWLQADGKAISLFFLGCVAVAGVFGALTASRKILIVQTVPAVAAAIVVVAS